MFDLHNKIALVTGASGGIGAQIATALHAQGATVVLHGTRASKLEALQAKLGERTATVTANLANRDAVAGLVDSASEAVGGPVNILVNNAGITRDALLMRMKNDDWDDVLEVNLMASMILCFFKIGWSNSRGFLSLSSSQNRRVVVEKPPNKCIVTIPG